MIGKKTAFGIIGAAAAGLLAVGAASPAFANGRGDDHGSSTSSSSYSSNTVRDSYRQANILRDISLDGFNYDPTTSTWAPVTVAPSVTTGPIASNDLNGNAVGSGDPVLSGNNVTAPVASGNDTAVGSGNDTAIGSGNDGNAVASGNSASNTTNTTTNTINKSVQNLVQNLTDGLGGGSSW